MAEDVWTSSSLDACETCIFRHLCFAPLPLELGPPTRSSKLQAWKWSSMVCFQWFRPRAGSATGPMGRLGPHSRPSSTSRIRLWVLLLLLDQHCRCRSSRDDYNRKRDLRPCCVWSQTEMDLHSIISYYSHPHLLLHSKKVSASIAMLSWWPKFRCSTHLPCLRQFWLKSSASEST